MSTTQGWRWLCPTCQGTVTPHEFSDRLCALTNGLETLRNTLAPGSWRRDHLSTILAALDTLIDAGAADTAPAPIPPYEEETP